MMCKTLPILRKSPSFAQTPQFLESSQNFDPSGLVFKNFALDFRNYLS